MSTHLQLEETTGQAPPSRRLRTAASFMIRFGLSAGLLWYLSRSLSPRDIGRRLADLDLGYLALSVALLCAISLLAALRWQQVASVICAGVRWPAIWRVLMIATFFDQLVFNMSGDALRIWFMNRMAPSISHAVSGVLLDRIVGFFSLVVLIIATLPFLSMLENIGPLIAAPLLLSGGCLAGVALILLFEFIPLPNFPLKASISLLSGVARSFVARRRTMLMALAAGLSVHLGVTLAIASIGHAIGLSISLGWYLILMPTIMLISLLPVSIGGWGVRESAMIVGLHLANVDSNSALLLSIVFGTIMTLIGLLGGLLLVFFPVERDAPSIQEPKNADR